MKKLLLLIFLIPLMVNALPSSTLTPATTLKWSEVTTYTDTSSLLSPEYKVYYTTTGEFSDIYYAVVSGLQVLITDLNLQDGEYMAAVTASDSSGRESSFSNIVTFTVQGGQPYVKQIVPVAPVLSVK